MNKKRDRHVTFCGWNELAAGQTGRQAELNTIDFLIENLKPTIVGDYRILVNYNIQLQGANALEVDIVVVNRYGVYLLEIKSWRGSIEAYDGTWLVDGRFKRSDALDAINQKSRILHGRLFSDTGKISALRRVNVIGLVVLYEGLGRFSNHSGKDTSAVVGLDDRLIRILNSTDLHIRRTDARLLDDAEIQRVRDTLYADNPGRTAQIVGTYRILGELEFGDLFDAFEAQHVVLESRRVRIKRYQLQNLRQLSQKERVLQFMRNAEVMSALGSHPNILNTIDFVHNPERPDSFYEVTELVDGRRLDSLMASAARVGRAIPLEQQLNYIEPLCVALSFAHKHRTPNGRSNPVYHRNLNPETVFVTREGVVKLADFDFAKFGSQTITVSGEVLVEKAFTAPEVLSNPSAASPASDIYALGVLWYFLACLPRAKPEFSVKQAEKLVDQTGLPKSARALLKRMVASLPAQRPSNAEDVLVQLQKLRQNE